MTTHNTRPPLLFLSHTLPYPPDSGVQIRTYNVLKLLAERYSIDTLCFYRKGLARGVEGSIEGLRPFVRSIQAFPIEQEQSGWRFLRDHLASAATRTVYTRHVYASAGFRASLRRLMSEQRYSIVHVDSLDLSGYLPDLGSLPVVCVHHNVESMLLRRRADVERSRLERAYLTFQAALMRKEEALWAPRVALNVVCSSDDAVALAQIAQAARIEVVPNGVDVHAFQPGPRPADGVLFMGGMTWFPNKDALDYFATDILPLIHARGQRPRVEWVGRALPETQALFAMRGVTLTGYVEDVRPFVLGARCFVVPLRVGGGTRLKILDAWAMGKAVVSTSVGCEGLNARDGWNILIRDQPADFAQAVVDVLGDNDLCDRLGNNARATAEDIYAWERIGRDMRRAYERAWESIPAGSPSEPSGGATQGGQLDSPPAVRAGP